MAQCVYPEKLVPILLLKYHILEEQAFEVGASQMQMVKRQRNLFCSLISLNATLFPPFSPVQVLVTSSRYFSSSDPINDPASTAQIYSRNNSHFEACIHTPGIFRSTQEMILHWLAFQPKTLHLRTQGKLTGGILNFKSTENCAILKNYSMVGFSTILAYFFRFFPAVMSIFLYDLFF